MTEHHRNGREYEPRRPATRCAKCDAKLLSRNPGPLCHPCAFTGLRTAYRRLAVLIRGKEWERQARCYTHAGRYPQELFFPENSQQVSKDRARACCMACPVRRQCLTLALELEASGLGPQVGIWGGTTGRQRGMAKHLPSCDRSFARARDCRGCRPMEERIEVLMEQTEQYARQRGLIEQEEVVA